MCAMLGVRLNNDDQQKSMMSAVYTKGAKVESAQIHKQREERIARWGAVRQSNKGIAGEVRQEACLLKQEGITTRRASHGDDEGAHRCGWRTTLECTFQGRRSKACKVVGYHTRPVCTREDVYQAAYQICEPRSCVARHQRGSLGHDSQ